MDRIRLWSIWTCTLRNRPVQGIAACRFTLSAECFVLWTKIAVMDERGSGMRFVVIEGEQFISPRLRDSRGGCRYGGLLSLPFSHHPVASAQTCSCAWSS